MQAFQRGLHLHSFFRMQAMCFGYSPKQITFKKWNILSDDMVQVISGKDKGTQGKVLKVYRKYNKVLVQGVNIMTKYVDDQDT